MYTNIHKHPLLRRATASLTGALIALSCHAVYEDTKAMLVSSTHEEVHGVAPAHTADAEARVRAFAEQLKAQREQTGE